VVNCDPNTEYRVQGEVALGSWNGQRYAQLIRYIENCIRELHLNPKSISSASRAKHQTTRGPSIRGAPQYAGPFNTRGKKVAPKTRKVNVSAAWISKLGLAKPLAIDRWSRFGCLGPPLFVSRSTYKKQIHSYPSVMCSFILLFVSTHSYSLPYCHP
jgi:hypothetical protein